ncbi:hypothetical protein AVEN_81704-1, partial [Araneus ventricosus]
YYIFYDEYRRRTHRKKTADDKGKESKMVSEAKPGIAGQDSCSRCSRLLEDISKPKLQLNLKLAEKEMQPLIDVESKDKLPIKLAVKIYTKTSEVQRKSLNNEKYLTRNVVYLKEF